MNMHKHWPSALIGCYCCCSGGCSAGDRRSPGCVSVRVCGRGLTLSTPDYKSEIAEFSHSRNTPNESEREWESDTEACWVTGNWRLTLGDLTNILFVRHISPDSISPFMRTISDLPQSRDFRSAETRLYPSSPLPHPTLPHRTWDPCFLT